MGCGLGHAVGLRDLLFRFDDPVEEAVPVRQIIFNRSGPSCELAPYWASMVKLDSQ